MGYYITCVQRGTRGYKMSLNMTSTGPLVHGLLPKDPIEHTNHVRNEKTAELLYFTVRAQKSVYMCDKNQYFIPK